MAERVLRVEEGGRSLNSDRGIAYSGASVESGALCEFSVRGVHHINAVYTSQPSNTFLTRHPKTTVNKQ
jgi:hypothetical protein